MPSRAEANLASYALPLASSLAASSLFTLALCQFPPDSLRSPSQLLKTAVILVAGSAAINLLAVSIANKVFSDLIEVPLGKAKRLTWLTVAWAPAAYLLAKEGSPWIMLLLPAIFAFSLALGLSFLQGSEAPIEEPLSPNERELFRPSPGTSPGLNLWLLAAVSLAMEAAVVAAGSRHYFVSAGLLAGCSTLPIWVLRARVKRSERAHLQSLPGMLTATCAALLLTMVALLPYLKIASLRGPLAGLLGVHPKPLPALRRRTPSSASGRAFESIVLIVPKKPNDVFHPVSKGTGGGLKLATKPLKIDFDGVYWYFQVPDIEVSPLARMIHGDPLKAGIHSADVWPIRMEAHQLLPGPIDLACCRTLELNLTDADQVPGEVSVQVILRDGGLPSSPQLSLGAKVLPSSRGNSLNRKQVDETLIFSFPNGATLRHFNQIVVQVQPGPDREVAAPNVAIRSFILVP